MRISQLILKFSICVDIVCCLWSFYEIWNIMIIFGIVKLQLRFRYLIFLFIKFVNYWTLFILSFENYFRIKIDNFCIILRFEQIIWDFIKILLSLCFYICVFKFKLIIFILILFIFIAIILLLILFLLF